ncbi:hypothetical protein VHUM_02383 [Vanrija humicola]|uniref:J domain-containing protein n=1 Tax=Vanrija humicola TaxID=5417 RepID=A0A7D8YX09_VANHU|nr:hypothetical protein VHUM_02383 [Vanrija humicola]
MQAAARSRSISMPQARAYSSPSAPTRPCPKCAAPIPLPASPCPKCGGLVPIPAGLSLHSLLDVSTPLPGTNGRFDIVGELDRLPAHGYALDARDLRNRMLRRQRDLHPDKQAAEVELAADLSGRVNKAYETLASPLRRAEYILKVLGKGTEETDAVTDHDLLMEILEARESLEEAEEAVEVEEMRDSNHSKVEDLVRRITESFSHTPVDLHATKALAVELKYWVGLEEAAKEKLGKLGEAK